MELALRFSNNQVMNLLSSWGYAMEEIEVWDNHTEYHNQVITTESKMWIAWKDTRPTNTNRRRLEDYYSFEAVMGREYPKRMFDLFWAHERVKLKNKHE